MSVTAASTTIIIFLILVVVAISRFAVKIQDGGGGAESRID